MKSSFGKYRYSIKRVMPVECLIIAHVILGAFSSNNDIINIVKYLLSIFLQIYAVVLLFHKKARWSRTLYKYIFVLFCICLIALGFFIKNIPVLRIVNRIAPLIAIFGIIVLATVSKVDFMRLVSLYVTVYCALATLINFDAALFCLSGKAVWPPIIYLGNRYCGPFGDPNFLALNSAVVLFMTVYIKFRKRRNKFFLCLMLAINLIIAGSVSTFVFMLFTVLIQWVFKPKNLRLKQVAILAVYCIALAIYAASPEAVRQMVVWLLSPVYGGEAGAIVKYHSLILRLDTQINALRLFCHNPFGYGPLQIVPMLGRDTHNSYFGTLFEEGLFGGIIIFVTLRGGRCNNKIIGCVTTFLMLSGLLLNIHYSTLYSFSLLLMHTVPSSVRAAKCKISSEFAGEPYVEVVKRIGAVKRT